MIKLKRDSQKGVTLVTLSIAIIIMMIITSVLIYNITTGSKVKALNNMYYDITKIKDKLDMYYINYHTIPILETPYKNTSHIQGINPNDNVVYYVIDLEALESMNLNYGQDYNTYKSNPSDTLTNLYIVNERSHSIYYAQGVLFDNKTYYTKPEESTKVELDSITNIQNVKVDQNIAVLRLNATDKENGIKQMKLMVNGQEHKTYDYTSDFRETKTEILNMPLVFGENYDCYLQLTDESNKVTESEHITMQNLTTIATAEDLQNLATLVNGGTNTFSGQNINLINDLDLNGSEDNQWVPIGNETNAFEGAFEGNEHSINNIYINTTKEVQGLFGNISNSEIKSVILTNGTINAGSRAGGIVGYCDSSNIVGCKNNVTVVGTANTGGICGSAVNSKIQNCLNKANITGVHSVGGITGYLYKNALITNCYNTGNIKTTTEGSMNNNYIAGGIVGYTSNIEGITTVVSNSYNTGEVYGYTHTGGIVGVLQGGGNHKITNCYSVGTLSGNSIYGIFGKYGSYNGIPILNISNNYWLTGCGATYGGYDAINDGATPCSEDELKNIANALGGKYKTDTNNINDGYPILTWQE